MKVLAKAAAPSILCAVMWLAVAVIAEAEQAKKVSRIGYLLAGTASSTAATREAFLDGLRRLGYVENRDVFIDYRYADGRNERLSELAADLVRLKVDVIMTAGTQATLAAKNATGTIPIVTPSSSGLLDKGLADRLLDLEGTLPAFLRWA